MKNELLSNASRAASGILLCLEREQHEVWDGLLDRDPAFLNDLWNTISPPKFRTNVPGQVSIFQWVEAYSDSRLRELSPSGWRAHRTSGSAAMIQQYLPNVDSDWCLEMERNKS